MLFCLLYESGTIPRKTKTTCQTFHKQLYLKGKTDYSIYDCEFLQIQSVSLQIDTSSSTSSISRCFFYEGKADALNIKTSKLEIKYAKIANCQSAGSVNSNSINFQNSQISLNPESEFKMQSSAVTISNLNFTQSNQIIIDIDQSSVQFITLISSLLSIDSSFNQTIDCLVGLNSTIALNQIPTCEIGSSVFCQKQRFIDATNTVISLFYCTFDADYHNSIVAKSIIADEQTKVETNPDQPIYWEGDDDTDFRHLPNGKYEKWNSINTITSVISKHQLIPTNASFLEREFVPIPIPPSPTIIWIVAVVSVGGFCLMILIVVFLIFRHKNDSNRNENSPRMELIGRNQLVIQ